MKRALITGITGQDGSYLAELLVAQGYRVTGLVRRSSSSSLTRIRPIVEKGAVHLVEGDLLDESSLRRALEIAEPHEIYNLAAMSHVKSSFTMASYTAEVNAIGVLRLLEAAREVIPRARFYQASTSELFGQVAVSPQNETTPFHPRSPYGVSKLYAFWSVVNWREAYDFYACNGILFNHESPRRGEEFVSRKISLAAAKIALGLQERVCLGNLDAKRDWGYAKDFVYGMWLMLQQENPKDFVLATGKNHSVRDFATRAFQEVGYSICWEGVGLEEKGRDQATGRILVEVSSEFFRPAEVDLLLGDASLARKELKWEETLSFEELVSLMVRQDYEALVERKPMYRC